MRQPSGAVSQSIVLNRGGDKSRCGEIKMFTNIFAEILESNFYYVFYLRILGSLTLNSACSTRMSHSPGRRRPRKYLDQSVFWSSTTNRVTHRSRLYPRPTDATDVTLPKKIVFFVMLAYEALPTNTHPTATASPSTKEHGRSSYVYYMSHDRLILIC